MKPRKKRGTLTTDDRASRAAAMTATKARDAFQAMRELVMMMHNSGSKIQSPDDDTESSFSSHGRDDVFTLASTAVRAATNETSPFRRLDSPESRREALRASSASFGNIAATLPNVKSECESDSSDGQLHLKLGSDACDLDCQSLSATSLLVLHNALDDNRAPSSLLLAATELRESMMRGNASGLVNNQFHIRARRADESKKKKPNTFSKVDAYKNWAVVCDVCNTIISVDVSYSSNTPLRSFTSQHLTQAGHRARGSEIAAEIKMGTRRTIAPKEIASESAAACSRLAIANHTPSTQRFDETTRRDTAAFAPVPMQPSFVQALLSQVSAFEFVKSDSGDMSSATHIRCKLCEFISKATVDQPAIVSELKGHAMSKAHIHRRRHRGGLKQLWTERPGPAPPPLPPPDLTRLCWGYYNRFFEVKGLPLNTDAIHEYDARN